MAMEAVDGTLALDARSLDSLRLKAKQDPQSALKGVAQQFEAVFLQTLLKSMRDASPQDGPMDSEQTRSLTAMLDQQLAQSLASRGIGLSGAMLKQLAPPAAGAAGTSAAKAPRAAADFVGRMMPYAQDASRVSGIPARFLIAQAALETGWGRHEIQGADGAQSFNVFGVKAGTSWKGATVEAATTEYLGGAPQRVSQKFRAYSSYAEAFQDYARLIRTSPRYAGLAGQSDGAAFALGLQRAGYASDPRYADKLTRVLSGVSA